MAQVARFILHTFGLPGAGLIFMLEGLGAPFPVEVPLWIIGSRMSTGQSSYWAMVFFMWGSTVAGNLIGYLAGYYGGRPAIRKLLQWFRVKPELWNKVEGWFNRHGLKVVVVTRWTNWGFAQSMWLSGITRVNFARFFSTMVVNDFLWAMAWSYVSRAAVGYVARHGMRVLHALTLRAGLAVLVVVALTAAIWLLIRYLRGRRRTA